MIRTRRTSKLGSGLCLFAMLLIWAGVLGGSPPSQSKGNVTLTGYPKARWKALTSYIDKPALGDVTGDGVPEIIGVSVFGDVFCVDGVTGQITWTYEDEHSFDLAIYICPALVDVDCDASPDIISVTPRGNVICLEGRTGRKLWSFKAQAPIVYSPTAFDLNRNGMPEIAVCDISGNLYLLSNTGKELLTVKSAAAFYGAPAMGLIDAQPAIIVSDRSGALRSFDGTNGNLIWKFAPGTAPISTSPIFFKDARDAATPWKVLAGTDSGDVFLVDARSGKMIWSRNIAARETVGDFSLGDIDGDGALELVCSTSGSRVVAADVADGRELWSRKFRVPVKKFVGMGRRDKSTPEALSGEPILADVDGNGRLDVIVEIRGLNNYIYCLNGQDGHVRWNYGTRDLYLHPALSSSSVISTFQELSPPAAFSDTVPVYSQPTPVIADFRRDGKADLIINDRDEVGLVSLPLSANAGAGAWPKYAANACNNIVNFSVPCLGPAAAPTISLTVEPKEIWEGESARLCWRCALASSIDIDQGIGKAAPDDCVTVSPARNTTWRAIARGCGGEAKDQISLAVKIRPPAPAPAPAVPTPPAAPVSSRQAEAWTLEDVFFEYDWYRLTPEAQNTLDENIRKLKAHPAARVALEATCDERGSIVYNEFLAVARVETVREYILAHGIDAHRIEARPFGKSTKWDPRHDESGWSVNRRVHFVPLP